MKTMRKWLALALSLVMVLSISAPAMAEGGKYTVETTADGWIKVVNEGGAVLGYSPDSGVTLLEVDGFAFKDMDKDGVLDVYENWRLDDETRAADLAAQLSLEQATGLMNLQFDRSGSSGVIGDDVKYQMDHGVRAFGNNVSSSVETTVSYVNMIQAYVEALDFAIPIEPMRSAVSRPGRAIWVWQPPLTPSWCDSVLTGGRRSTAPWASPRPTFPKSTWRPTPATTVLRKPWARIRSW